MTELRNETATNSGITLRKKSDSTKINVYRLCERWAEKVAYLKSNLTNTEIAELKTDKNASLNIIGLVSELEKNNTKEKAIRILKDLMKSDIKFISFGCSDAISTMPISQYYLSLITDNNLFFKPKFKLKNKEIRQLKKEIINAENKFWRN
ncbi:hypothetical protein [Polaribacter sp.]|uniref:hypothetical protein n=2 Tax=Flavobacteriaceae TaxID=49546 RepID=UPI0040478240